MYNPSNFITRARDWLFAKAARPFIVMNSLGLVTLSLTLLLTPLQDLFTSGVILVIGVLSALALSEKDCGYRYVGVMALGVSSVYWGVLAATAHADSLTTGATLETAAVMAVAPWFGVFAMFVTIHTLDSQLKRDVQQYRDSQLGP